MAFRTDGNEIVLASGGDSPDSYHADYVEFLEEWLCLRDHLAGTRRIKEEGTKYLPALGDDADKYVAYKMRALYYEATKRTHQALLGALLMKPAQYQGIENEDFGQVTPDGFTMPTFQRNVLSELIAVGRTGVLVDLPRDDSAEVPYFVQYSAEDIINWRFERVNDRIQLTLVVLREKYEEAKGRFGTDRKTRYRVLELIDGVYVQSEHKALRDDKDRVAFQSDGEIVPMKRGQPLDYIPFVFFTPLGNVPQISEPPLSPLAAINESHYRTSADLEHGRHFTGLPTAWVAGFDPDTVLEIGSQVAWVSSDPAARAGFLEFTGQGLRALETAMAEKQEQMATMGARMLRAPRNGVEAAETARIYQSAESGTLAGLAQAASESFTQLLKYWAEWQGQNPDGLSVEFNTDYIDTRMDPAMLTSLLAAWQTGAISYDSLFYNLRQGELIPDKVTIEDERGLIESEGPSDTLTDTE